MRELDALPIVQYWHSEEIPTEVRELTATFRDLNPGLHHMLFNEKDAGAFVAERFGKRELTAFRSCAVPAMQADYFRLCAVLELGGICADVDLLCIEPLQSLIDSAGRGLLFENRHGHILNGFFVFPGSHHPLLRLTLDVATENIERRVSPKVHEVTGPWVLSLLRLLLRRGSLERARRDAAGRRVIEPLVESMIEAVGDFDRVREAFEGVRVDPIEKAWRWLAKPAHRPLYKEHDLHWEHWHRLGRDIYRRSQHQHRPSSAAQ